MDAIRQIYEHAPSAIAIPEAMQHKRLEVILLVQDEMEAQPASDLKKLLASMPNVGDDADFNRTRDYGRGDVAWDS